MLQVAVTGLPVGSLLAFAGRSVFVLSARLDFAEAAAGQTDELTVVGFMLNGLQLSNVSSYITQIVIGLAIVLAVALDLFPKSRRKT